MQTLIEIAYAIHDHYGSYYKYLGVSLLSVMENTREELRFHILCDETLTEDARKELSELCKSFDKEIYFYDIALDERISVSELLESGYCEGILYRLYLPELLPDISKIIYLDCDILANGDIKGLWDTEVSDICTAGRFDPPLLGFMPLTGEKRRKMEPFWEETDWNRYINSGVLVMNLDRIRREHKLLEESISFWNKHTYSLPDQDAINFVFRGKTGFIPGCFNMPNKDCPVAQKGFFYHYSYIGDDVDKLDQIDKLYLDYWKRTPFYDEALGKKEKISFLRDLKNRSEVYERLEKIRDLTDQEVIYFCIQLYLRGDYEGSYNRLLTIDKAGANEPYIRRGLMAKCLRKAGRTSEAITLLKENLTKPDETAYLDKNESELELWDLLGELYYEDTQYEKAKEAYKNALYFGNVLRNENALRALGHLIRCALKMDDISEAEEYYSMLSSLRPLDDAVKIYGLEIGIAKRARDKKINRIRTDLPIC